MPSLCDALLKRPSARRAAVLRARPGCGRSESYLLYDSHTSIDTIHGNSRLVTTSIVTKRGKRCQRGSQHQEPFADHYHCHCHL